MNNLPAGTRIKYDGRANGVQTGMVQRREVIQAYRSGDPSMVYYHVSGAGLLVPAEDVLEVL